MVFRSSIWRRDGMSPDHPYLFVRIRSMGEPPHMPTFVFVVRVLPTTSFDFNP